MKAAFFFDYGQRSLARERAAAADMCGALGVELKIIRLPWLREITASSLVKKSVPLPILAPDRLDARPRRTARAVWVPNRNACLVSIAASFAEALRCDSVVAGFNREEGESFPDNSKAFSDAMDQTLLIATDGKVRLLCPLIDMDKAQIVKYGIETGAPLDMIWSCYEGRRAFCWRCESCARLERALRRNGRLDWFRGVNRHAGK